MAVRQEVKGLTDQIQGVRTLVTDEMKGLRELVSNPQQQEQELRDAAALQASMKTMIDGLKTLQDLLQDTPELARRSS